jgi:PAP_fibrillin.
MMRIQCLLSFILLLAPLSDGFSPHISLSFRENTASYSTTDDVGPSDYDSNTLIDPSVKPLAIDLNPEDELIRDDLKRELLLLSSVSDRGLFLSNEEKDIVVDIITQLEALNPTEQTARECYGEWDLVMASTQAFKSSPFFQAIRVVLNDKNAADNVFGLHEAATSIGKVGRVKQMIGEDGSFTSEVNLELGIMPGMPITVKGTVITKASFEIVGSEQLDLFIRTTQVKKSNVPVLDQLLDQYPFELPVGDIYNRVGGNVPVVSLKTFYVDESMRITRDVDDNFYVFSRA